MFTFKNEINCLYVLMNEIGMLTFSLLNLKHE